MLPYEAGPAGMWLDGEVSGACGDAVTEIVELFEACGARGRVHARTIDGTIELGVGADDAVPAASVFKLPVLLEVARQCADERLDPLRPVHVPAAGRASGPTGLSALLDDVTLSVRDLAAQMMCVSDNAATDVLLEMVGMASVNATLRELGLQRTVIRQTCAQILGGMTSDLTTSSGGLDLAPEALARLSSLDPETTNETTARDTTALLAAIWSDEAGEPAACAEARRVLALQLWPHRLTSGFGDEVVVAGKTGTLPSIRHEAGVVTYPDGGSYAVAVFTRTAGFEARRPDVDRSIGRAARLAVEELRRREGCA
ncbi:MAG: beta-lactamase class [Actinomycetota bacterium]|nr:beta-lactamase class [Actinomycetota bacterium]